MGTKSRGCRGRPGFTKVELLIVIVIVAILAAVAIPFVLMGRVVDAATRCTNNLKEIGLAVQKFESTNKRMPPLYGGSDGDKVKNSVKFSDTWGSTHVFLLPFVGKQDLYNSMATQTDPIQYDPSTRGGPANSQVVTTYVCPADPSMTDGMANGFGGTSYAANAQVFAPLQGETLTGTGAGMMLVQGKPNQFNRGSTLARLQDGTSNIIFFTHSYALCGSDATGTIWGYGAGINKSPAPIDTFQPWSRASYLGQTYITPANKPAFQNQPNPYLTKCVVTDPATPHTNVMLVGMGDASVRIFAPNVSSLVWNDACLPNNDSILTPDW